VLLKTRLKTMQYWPGLTDGFLAKPDSASYCGGFRD
jgi:hypothetical protein